MLPLHILLVDRERYRVEACVRVDVYAEKYACFFSSPTLNWITSCECWRNIEYFWEGDSIFASEYCPTRHKIITFDIFENF